MFCLSARLFFVLALLQRSVILVESSESQSVWLGLLWLASRVFPLLGVGFFRVPTWILVRTMWALDR